MNHVLESLCGHRFSTSLVRNYDMYTPIFESSKVKYQIENLVKRTEYISQWEHFKHSVKPHR